MKILVIHALQKSSRLTTVNHAVFPARHWQGATVYFKNVYGDNSTLPSDASFDVGIVTYEVLALRNLPYWKYVKKLLLSWLRQCDVRIAFPQDEFTNAAAVDSFMVEASFSAIFTPITRDFELLYPKSIGENIPIREAMNGYWEAPIAGVARPTLASFVERARDLSQRVAALPPVFGNFGRRKSLIAQQFTTRAAAAGFSCDVSTSVSKVLLGSDWFRFLQNTRFTIGSRAGASRVDRNGCLTQKALRLPVVFPNLTWEQQYSLLGVKNMPKGDFSSVSPRVLECAGAGVCQILERDEYFPNFNPWEHYIPLNFDLSDIDTVFQAMRDHDLCYRISLNAFDYLISSGRYTYHSLVNTIQETCDLPFTHATSAEEVVDLDVEPYSVAFPNDYLPLPRRKKSLIEALIVPWTPAIFWLGNS